MPGPLARDTSPAIQERQIARWRAMTPTEKLEQVGMLRETALEMARAGIRLQFPGISEHECFLRLMKRTLGDELVRCVYPEIAALDPIS